MENLNIKGSIDESEMSDNFRIKTKKTELLFLELIYNSLANGGRCAVIIPNGVLFGNSNAHRSTRKLILENCRLDAVISMPSGVFKPYAGVSTAVLFFTKGEPTKKVWFYDMKSDGFSLDDKRAKINANDIPDILEKFSKRKEKSNEDRKKKYFFVPIEEIKDKEYNLSFSTYKEDEEEQIEYKDPKIVKKELISLEKEILEGLNDLKEI